MLPLIIAAAGAYLIGSSKVSKFAEGGRLEYNREEYNQLLQKYDRVGAFLDDAEDEQEKEKYRKELAEIGAQLHRYERNEYGYDGIYRQFMAKGGVLNIGVYDFNYRMLDRLRQDNEYYLGYGNRSPKNLWAGSVDGQIAEMIKLYNEIPDNKKPEWISMQDILEYEKKMKGSDGVMAKGGKIEVVNNEGSGKVINQLYNQWNSIKTKAQQDKWAEKVRNTKFGTYGTISLMEILDRFDFDEAHINSVVKEDFKKEIKAALKSQYADGGVMAKGGILLASSPTLDGIKNMIGKYFYSSNISIKQIGDTNEYEVHNAKGNINAFKVVFNKGKYRFEQKETGSYADGGKVLKFRKGSSYYYKNQFQFRAEKVVFVDYELGMFIFKDSNGKEFELLQYQVDEYITKDAPIVNIGIEFADYLRGFISEQTDENPSQLSFSLSDNINEGKNNGEIVIKFIEEIKEGRDSRFEKDDILKLNGKSFSHEGITLTFSSIKFIGEEEQETDSTYSVYVYYYYDVKYSINYKKVFADGGKIEVARGGVIATTILSQLGGAGRLNVMTGAYNFVDNGNGLSFKIKNPKANYIKITLNGMDLYDIEIGRIRGDNYKIVKEVNDVYFDQLKGIIEETTGMYLSL